jgi:microcystin-dependent protein
MKKIMFLISTVSFAANAQVGINTSTPDTSAALDIRSPSGSEIRGVLLPKMSTTQRDEIQLPAKGLIVYDSTKNIFQYFDGNKWMGLMPVEQSTSLQPKSINGNIIVDSGRIETPNLAVTGFSLNALVPTGAIIMWSGAVVPDGWALCDGSSGHPDLRGRFIVGAGQNASPAPGDSNPLYSANSTGGENGHTLIKSQLPTHQHLINSSPNDGGLVTIADDTHSHSFTGTSFLSDDFNDGEQTDASGSQENGNLSLPNTDDATHNHTISGSTGNGTTDGLANQPHENRPPYYVLAYIIKLP